MDGYASKCVRLGPRRRGVYCMYPWQMRSGGCVGGCTALHFGANAVGGWSDKGFRFWWRLEGGRLWDGGTSLLVGLLT